MSDTPETDGAEIIFSPLEGDAWVPASISRKLERERNEAREDARLLSDRLTFLELKTTDELAGLEREKDEAREEVEDLKARYQSAMVDRDSYRFQAEQKWAMRRELEELLGIDNGAPGDEQFKKGVKALKAVMKKAKLYDEKN